MKPQIERSPPAPDEARNAAAHPPGVPERVVELPLTELYPFKDHPFHVVDDAHMLSTAQSIMPDMELKVDENWVEPEPFTLVNIPNHYEFVKTDNKGNPLPGVQFTLEDGAGNIIREIETLEGYTLSEETIKVVIDEKYIVPDEMLRFVNYPNIQTGAGFEMTPLMWTGVALVIVSSAAVVAFMLLNKRRPRS